MEGLFDIDNLQVSHYERAYTSGMWVAGANPAMWIGLGAFIISLIILRIALDYEYEQKEGVKLRKQKKRTRPNSQISKLNVVLRAVGETIWALGTSYVVGLVPYPIH